MIAQCLHCAACTAGQVRIARFSHGKCVYAFALSMPYPDMYYSILLFPSITRPLTFPFPLFLSVTSATWCFHPIRYDSSLNACSFSCVRLLRIAEPLVVARFCVCTLAYALRLDHTFFSCFHPLPLSLRVSLHHPFMHESSLQTLSFPEYASSTP